MSTYNVGNVEIALTSQMNEAVKAIKQLSAELNRISGVLNKTRVGVDNVGKSTRNVGNEAKKASKSLSGMFTLGKLYFFVNYTRRMAQGLAGIVQSAIDYTETLNKFEVSMGNSYERALAFQEKLHEAYGLAKADLMDYQANFNNIIKGLGNVDVDVAYNMSETLTTMAIDFASLFNTSIDSAMTKFQSALTQQVRPIRSVSGFDITTPTLKSVMQNIGITDRQISQLNQVEKRLLIIIALEQQMRNVGAQMTNENGEAMGDFARTIENPANQLKILSQQLKETGIAIGNLALRWIAPAIPYVLGFVMAIRTLIETLASLIGFEPSTAKPPLIEFEDSANSATGAVGKTKKAVEDLKKATTGIDELNIIQQPKDTSGGGAGGGGLPGIDNRLLAELEKYQPIINDINTKAKQVRDRILNWFGSDTEERLEKLKKILWGIATVMGLIAAIKIGKSIANIFELVGIVLSAPEILAIVAGVVVIALGIIRLLQGISEYNDENADKVQAILKIIEGIGIALGVITFGASFLIAAIAFVAELIYKNWEKIKSKFSKVFEFFDKIKEKAQEFFAPVKQFFATTVENIKRIFDKVKEIIAKIIEIAVALAGAFNTYIWQPLKKKIDEVVKWVKQNIIEPIKKALEPLITWIDEHIFQKIATIIDRIKFRLLTAIEGIINTGILAVENMFNLVIIAINKIIQTVNKIPGVEITPLGALKLKRVNFTEVTAEAPKHVPKGGMAYATGGFPTRGDYFLANENGVPEYVGSIGGRTAVANTNQIIQGISYGVSMAQSEQNQLLRQQNEYLRRILEKPNGVFMNGRDVANELDRVQVARGAKVIAGGY